MNDINNKTVLSGRCLCGAVEMHTGSASPHVGACHCEMCRIWSSGPYMAVDCGIDVKFTGGEHISIFSSSEWAERGFCSKCGSNLFYRIKKTGQLMMSAGLFTQQDAFTGMDRQVFTDAKPNYYDFKNETIMMTAEEVFAKYGPGG